MKTIFPTITSRKNPLVTDTASLQEKKYRYEKGLFLLEGEKLVKEALSNGLPVERILLSEGRAEAHMTWLCEAESPAYRDLPIYLLADDCFLKISSEKAPQGVIAVVKHLDFFKRKTIIYSEDISALAGKRAVILYGLQDPGNLGAVIRSAVAFGVDVILLSADCADLYNSKTIRAAMGSLFHIQAWIVEDVASLIAALQSQGRRVLAAELRENSIPLRQAAITEQDCVIIGNEGHGIPSAMSALCDAGVYLPISANAESLNAAVAAAIFLWEQSKF